jgi:hypothetical protein
MADAIHIVQKSLHPQTKAIETITITVRYGDHSEAEATILVRPGALPNDDKSIRREFERLGQALIAAAQSVGGITS